MSDARPDEVMWSGLLNNPLVVLLIARRVPVWLDALAAEKPVLVLSQFEATISHCQQLAGIVACHQTGLGAQRDYYGALRKLCGLVANEYQEPSFRDDLRTLEKRDIFTLRSRLAFIPPFPFPQPTNGRAAAYLLGRISNNHDEPGLDPRPAPDAESFFRATHRWSLAACRALALVESGVRSPAGFPVGLGELKSIRTHLSGDLVDADKFSLLIELGRRLHASHQRRQFVTVAIPRRDLAQGHVPSGAELPPDFRRWSTTRIKALRDFSQDHTESRPKHGLAVKTYDLARETLLLEERLLSCATSAIAARCDAEPWQFAPGHGLAYGPVSNLRAALDGNSRKVAALFGEVQAALASLLPPGFSEVLAEGDSSVTFFSDLPFEWVGVNGFPLCLTRPVSRVPVGHARTDVLTAVLESQHVLSSQHPERTLVLDLIAASDSIRSDWDSFLDSSRAIGQNYTHCQPKSAEEARKILTDTAAEIVVVDAHGLYDAPSDTLKLEFAGGARSLEELIPLRQVPSVWILAACDTAVTGAMRGCFVRKLLSLGAVCVVATQAKVDSFTASMFVGRLLTEIYSPVERAGPRTLRSHLLRDTDDDGTVVRRATSNVPRRTARSAAEDEARQGAERLHAMG